MEKSIKRVENLVHVTNTALAQMKFSLMFDDISGETSSKAIDPKFVTKLLEEDDLKQCQGDFKTETNEMLEKMESMFRSKETSRRKSKAVDKIKEINHKMSSLRLDESKPKETEQSRQKFLSLISEERFSPRELQEKPKISHGGFHETDSVLAKSPIKSKEELKSRLLETQEIVNRGCQTARQLSQKVETMSKLDRKEKSPNSSEIAMVEETESNETINAVKCRRCLKKKRKKREPEEEKVVRVNTRVIDIRRKEKSNLQVQHLPSLHIKGGLQLQKIHNLEIPAGGDDLCLKSNTSISFFSHDQVEKEKLGLVIEKERKEDCCCSMDVSRGNYLKCFNCGRLIKVGPTRVDPEEVDKILKQCNFNVYDPRIDEFVEKCGMGATKNGCEKTQGSVEGNLSADGVAEPEFESKKSEEGVRKNKIEAPETRSHYTLQKLSDRLLKKYKQEADSIERNHLKLDSILQNIFRQIDESRGVFEKCHFFKNKKERFSRLSTSKPVLITLTGERRHGKRRKSGNVGAIKTIAESSRIQKESFLNKSAETKRNQALIFASVCTSANGNSMLDTKEMSGKLKSSSGGLGDSSKILEMKETEGGGISPTTTTYSTKNRCSKPSKNIFEKEGFEDIPRTSWVNYRTAEPSDGVLGEGECRRKSPGRNGINRKPFEVSPDSYSPLGSSSSKKNVENPEAFSSLSEECNEDEVGRKTFVELGKEKMAASDSSTGKSENNYESDFESTTNEHEDNGGDCEEEEEELEAKLCANKLSTISEEGSELEIKLSDEQKTPRNTEHMGACKVFEVELVSEKADLGAGISTESGKTEYTPPKNTESTQLVTSLKDILSALKDQFVRTEALAERLTENTKEERMEKTKSDTTQMEGVTLTPWKVPIGANLVENLRTARKESGGGLKSPKVSQTPGKATRERSEKTTKAFSSDSLSDEGGSSLGEIRPSDRRRPSGGSSVSECSFSRCDGACRSAGGSSGRGKAGAKTIASGKFDVNVEEASYSEGEVPAHELSPVEPFGIGSLGEVLSLKNSI